MQTEAQLELSFVAIHFLDKMEKKEAKLIME
jgi:hypothetical protein